MQLSFRRFGRDDFAEYAAWFVDPELDRWLGPMDEEWLEAVLSEGASEGTTWAVFREAMLVAVVETWSHPSNRSLAAITGLAVKPGLRRQGLGGAVLRETLAVNQRRGRFEHLAYIHGNNGTAQECFKRAGFVSSTMTPNGEGHLEFRHTARRALEPARV